MDKKVYYLTYAHDQWYVVYGSNKNSSSENVIATFSDGSEAEKVVFLLNATSHLDFESITVRLALTDLYIPKTDDPNRYSIYRAIFQSMEEKFDSYMDLITLKP